MGHDPEAAMPIHTKSTHESIDSRAPYEAIGACLAGPMRRLKIPSLALAIVERAGHNAPKEQPAEVIQAVRDFMATANVPESRLTTR
jgi:pimeloyl-ACP methyl ester carboxylesterase